MKKINKIILLLLLSSFSFVGCNSLLDVDSDRIVSPEDYDFSAANDTLYSMFAIYSQLEKLADRYVILGELRGDLMDVSEKSSIDLKEINNFEISASNPYNNIKDYYSIINNCNYIIHNIDTSVVKGGRYIMLKEYAACKAIRAWTYMQIALNYGAAIYYDQPILTVEDATTIQKQPVMTLEELAPTLINDLQPYKNVDNPSLGTYNGYNLKNTFFPIRFLLGDLYLWTGQYENAAQEYYTLINNNTYLIRDNMFETVRNTTISSTGTVSFTDAWTYYGGGWDYLFTKGTSEHITDLLATNQYGNVFQIDSLAANSTLTPSAVALNNWNTQMYYHSAVLDTLGDLRKYGSVYSENNRFSFNDFFNTDMANFKIYKYRIMNERSDSRSTPKTVAVYRVALLYLRYAEALNRLEMPNTAFAILKKGLNATNFVALPKNEKVMQINQRTIKSKLNNTVDSVAYDTTYTAKPYANFSDTKFSTNIGVRMRGLGNVHQDTTHYIIPNLTTKQDTILFVEDKIQEELALETAFEGNRFQDLMRFAIRRNDNSYLADKVSQKHVDNAAAIKTKLLQREKWYLSKK
ncbi:MAG: RagB/SusD family nutrient uptake outer membrane protein [Paludibacteraceae bacterium]